jgi:SAM-dependent methyltransferase
MPGTGLNGPVDQVRRPGYNGTGPGPITPDGCAVRLYERLPVGPELDVIAYAVPAGGTLLELGCGTGRMTRPLLDSGFTVTAVDESPEMLQRVHRARTVCSTIETLDLAERFDVVMLASFLIHAPDEGVRRRLLGTARRHVTDDGYVLIQREGSGWHENLPRTGTLGGGTARIVSSQEVAPGVRSVHAEYDFPDARWTQTFLCRPLTRRAFEDALTQAGLAVDSYLTQDGTWVRAVPVRPSAPAEAPGQGPRRRRSYDAAND